MLGKLSVGTPTAPSLKVSHLGFYEGKCHFVLDVMASLSCTRVTVAFANVRGSLDFVSKDFVLMSKSDGTHLPNALEHFTYICSGFLSFFPLFLLKAW